MPASPLSAWLTLQAAPGLGPRTLERLVAHYGNASLVLEQSAAELAERGLAPATIAALRAPDQALIDAALAWAEQPDCHILARDDARYPRRLAEIPDPPPLLYVRGDVALLNEPQIAVVGSRNSSSAGDEVTRYFARALAERGLVITSGLAAGIDAAAHAGALEAGRTLAVLGTGADRVYPPRNRNLARAIVEQGALITELALGSGPQAYHFPRRNRIISGLSLGVLVTEAALRSGSLITARQALEQGREVFALPGSIRNPLARGCHALIREGARLVEEPLDILEELVPQLRAALKEDETPASSGAPVTASVRTPPDADQARLLAALGFEPMAADELGERTGLSTADIVSMLVVLELEGHVSSLPGGRYSRCLG
ncbi:MAG: DNA-processing protein DprA [Chromatiaceae bacterium]|nr:DNA-processing protein DprA [Chromatiaceae bacterium]